MFNQPLPTSDSDAAILLDLFGVSRTITITGIFSGTTSAINTFIGVIETIASGSQSGVTYASSLSTFASKKVFVRSFNWNYIQGSPSKINYTLDMVEGA